VASYYNNYHDLRSIERPNGPLAFPVVIGNGLKGNSYGVELVTEYQVNESWRLRAAYSPLKTHFGHEPGSTDPNPGTNESHDSDHQFSARSAMDLPAHLEFDHTFRYVSRIVNQNVPGYAELDARLAWRYRKLELSIAGRNLLHPRHAEFGTLPSRREIQRSADVKLLWSF